MDKKELIDLLKNHKEALLSLWVTEQKKNSMLKSELLPEVDLQKQSSEFLSELLKVCDSPGFSPNIKLGSWDSLWENLEKTTKARIRFGLSHVEASPFILSLKIPWPILPQKSRV